MKCGDALRDDACFFQPCDIPCLLALSLANINPRPRCFAIIPNQLQSIGILQWIAIIMISTEFMRGTQYQNLSHASLHVLPMVQPFSGKDGKTDFNVTDIGCATVYSCRQLIYRHDLT